jgi:hypothetical protein
MQIVFIIFIWLVKHTCKWEGGVKVKVVVVQTCEGEWFSQVHCLVQT